jgi:hypothetical protein
MLSGSETCTSPMGHIGPIKVNVLPNKLGGDLRFYPGGRPVWLRPVHPTKTRLIGEDDSQRPTSGGGDAMAWSQPLKSPFL